MPYANYGGFGQDYFDGASVADPHPAGYTDYRRELLPFDHYADVTANIIQNHGADPSTASVLIVGCAVGYTVEWLQNTYGTDAWGMDISQYAVDNSVTSTIRQGDVLSANDLKAVRREAPGGKFDVILTECVLECLTDSEAQTAAENCRGEVQQGVAHRLWTVGDDLNSSWYNSKTLSEWQTLVDSTGEDSWYADGHFRR